MVMCEVDMKKTDTVAEEYTEEGHEVLCVSSAYEKKFYLNENFGNLPDSIKDELKIMCVIFTEDVGGILIMEFDSEGTLLVKTMADEGDYLYDDIGAGYKIRQLQNEKEELFGMLEMYYRTFFLDETVQ